MFDQTFVDGTQQTKKPLTLSLSILMQLFVLSVLLLIPLIYTETLPAAVLKSLLVAPPPPVVRIPSVAAKTQTVRTARLFNGHELTAPVVVPNRVTPINDIAAAPDIGAIAAYGQSDGPAEAALLSTVGSGSAPPPMPEPVAKPKPTSAPMRIGTGVAAANLISKVTPPYPELAKSARIQGAVEFRALISKEGNIENLQVLRGHPLLVKAATDAVLQWKYRPTLLNGEPVEVITDILVNFTLSQ